MNVDDLRMYMIRNYINMFFSSPEERKAKFAEILAAWDSGNLQAFGGRHEPVRTDLQTPWNLKILSSAPLSKST